LELYFSDPPFQLKLRQRREIYGDEGEAELEEVELARPPKKKSIKDA
jgi:hypothetical protein